MKHAFTATTLAATLGLAAALAVESRQSSSFVKTSGQQFTLGGQKFTVVGSNSYWMAQLSSTADITTAFKDLKNAGFTTLRTWGFNEVTSPSGTYYQIWNGKTATLNTGADGLGKFDTVVAQAKAAGIRLIVPLTNNWSDYGGMDVYVKQLLGSNNHDLFYTDATVKNAFKKYISGFVGRYKNEPTIMAWELANEPRCKGSTGTSTGTCTTKTITEWATEMSKYIKSIAPNHLVQSETKASTINLVLPHIPTKGRRPVLEISSIDFGTAHSYPEHWGQESNVVAWGTQWIIDHAASQKAANKPVILEEFGVTSSYNPSSTYTKWWDTIVSSGLAGDLIWQAGSTVSTGKTHDDGFTVYPDEPEYALQTKYAAALKARK
ncbi:glycosyl hydrolase 5 (cellulase A) family [Rhizoctonia solani]|uniref:mannan endo-1,4-beta-mannosidase n=1 Tax=Rhizoctonia solani TaxID=456999 RepID=A0A8H7M5Z4_9AGAM|nr:glycosyl hydrolase 5 (cellulase A) family [Rhizoctonia solani]